MTSGPGSGWQTLTLALFRRIRADLAESLTPDAAWLAWHIARGQDRNLSELTARPQLWLSAGWAARFHRAPDPSDTGYGHTPAQAAAFRAPSLDLLLAYQAATHELAEHYLLSASDHDLTRPVVSPTLGNTHTVEERLTALIREGFAHTGQMALVK
ncbi:DinB family protein [Streptomyces sp. NBC_01537]|uniref:DinB family protein n=1 Tax=Streptomyces sp. NBC_01537 TaxID=2903896 RepID=UPI00386C33AF